MKGYKPENQYAQKLLPDQHMKSKIIYQPHITEIGD